MFFSVYTNEGDNAKRSNAQKYYLPKGISKNYNVIINGKKFYDQVIDSDIKGYEQIRKMTTGQGEDCSTGCLLDYEITTGQGEHCATGCLLDYDYTKNHYRCIAVDLSRQKELDADPKTIQQIEFIG